MVDSRVKVPWSRVRKMRDAHLGKTGLIVYGAYVPSNYLYMSAQGIEGWYSVGVEALSLETRRVHEVEVSADDFFWRWSYKRGPHWLDVDRGRVRIQVWLPEIKFRQLSESVPGSPPEFSDAVSFSDGDIAVFAFRPIDPFVRRRNQYPIWELHWLARGGVSL